MSERAIRRESARKTKGVPPSRLGFDQEKVATSHRDVEGAKGTHSSVRDGSSLSASILSIATKRKRVELEFNEKVNGCNSKIEDLELDIRLKLAEVNALQKRLDSSKADFANINPNEDIYQSKKLEISTLQAELIEMQSNTEVLRLVKERDIKRLQSEIEILIKTKELRIAEIDEEEAFIQKEEDSDHEERDIDRSGRDERTKEWVENATTANEDGGALNTTAEDAQKQIEEILRDLKLKQQEQREKFERDQATELKELEKKLTANNKGPDTGTNDAQPTLPQSTDPMVQALMAQTAALTQFLSRDPTRSSERTDRFLARQSTGKDLPIFTGRPDEWPSFIADYKRTTEVCGFSDAENLSRLRKCLKGEAAKAVQCLLVSPENLKDALKLLETRFGQSEHMREQ